MWKLQEQNDNKVVEVRSRLRVVYWKRQTLSRYNNGTDWLARNSAADLENGRGGVARAVVRAVNSGAYMRVLVVLALGLAAGVASPVALFADAASKDAKIEQLLVLVRASTMAAEDQAFAILGAQLDKVSQNLVQVANIPEPERKAAAADILAKLTAALKEFGSWENLKPSMMEAYRDTYTEEELDGLLAFFNSPIGQTYMTKSVVVMTKTHELNAKRLKEFGYIAQGIMRDWVAGKPQGRSSK